jgi:uncharacterized membrane protein
MNKFICEICKKHYPAGALIKGHGIRHEIENLLLNDYPEWNDESRICQDDYNVYRMKYISNIIEEEKGNIEELDKSVIRSINENEIITSDTNKSIQEVMKFGGKLADRFASFGGSWRFILIFAGILLIWIFINSFYMIKKPFDPYPFIFLNLILSCLAAIQAPIIMMSQNRQELKDRMRSENDYKVNLKSEIEIRTLHEKVNHLLLDQWSKMMSIQEIQMEILEEIKSGIQAKK